jgi:hypothetical protein
MPRHRWYRLFEVWGILGEVIAEVATAPPVATSLQVEPGMPARTRWAFTLKDGVRCVLEFDTVPDAYYDVSDLEMARSSTSWAVGSVSRSWPQGMRR